MRILSAVASPIVADDDGIATAQTPGAAGNLTLNGVGVGTYTYMNAANGSYDTSSRLEARFSPPRPVLITTVSNESAKTLTIYGTDRAGMQITETLTGPNATTGLSTKLFASVYRIAVSAAFTGNVIAGWSAVSYTNWIFIGNFVGAGTTWKLRSMFAATGTCNYDIEATSMSMNKRALYGVTHYDSAPTYSGGDYPDDLAVLAAAQTGNYTSDNDTSWAAVRLKVNSQDVPVRLRIIPNTTA